MPGLWFPRRHADAVGSTRMGVLGVVVLRRLDGGPMNERQKARAPKIVQLLPADGWQAVHCQDGKPFTSPLLCWALLQTPDARDDDDAEFGEVFPWGEQAIVGITAMRDGEIVAAMSDSNFLGYLEADGDLSIFDEDAREYAERRKR